MPAPAVLPAAAAPVGQATDAVPATSVPAMQAQMINLSLLDALAEVRAPDLAGVFSFISEGQAPAAFADYLLHEQRALKRFIKRARRDLKDVGGINGWDRVVFMYIMQINGSGMPPPGIKPLSEKLQYDISEFVLARPLSLQEITARRRLRR